MSRTDAWSGAEGGGERREEPRDRRAPAGQGLGGGQGCATAAHAGPQPGTPLPPGSPPAPLGRAGSRTISDPSSGLPGFPPWIRPCCLFPPWEPIAAQRLPACEGQRSKGSGVSALLAASLGKAHLPPGPLLSTRRRPRAAWTSFVPPASTAPPRLPRQAALAPAQSVTYRALRSQTRRSPVAASRDVHTEDGRASPLQGSGAATVRRPGAPALPSAR